VDRKHGREPVDYFHDDLKPILEETYGIIVYQEQIMQIGKNTSCHTGFSSFKNRHQSRTGQLASSITSDFQVLKEGGRLAVISYHSLEDRIVKQFFKRGRRGQRLASDKESGKAFSRRN